MKTYATRADAIEAEVVAPIEAGHVDSARAEYEVDAIGDQVLYFHDAYDEDSDTYRLDQQGYRLKPDFLDPEEFWTVVKAHAKSPAELQLDEGRGNYLGAGAADKPTGGGRDE